MPTVTENIIIKVDAKGARTAQRDINNIGKSAGKTASALSFLKKAFTFLAGGLLVRELIRLSDSFTTIQNRLKLVTSGTSELNRVTDELFAISQRTRSSFQTNAELFNRLALSTKELGLSEQELLGITESLNQAVIVSGATSAEANNALIQLSQGLASGALRGDELRSVLEQLPFVADVIAKQLGVTRGQLREMGATGAITAEQVVLAFKNAREEIAVKFAKTVPTIGQAFVVLRNQLIFTIGQLLTASGASDAFAQTIINVANAINEFTPALLFVARALSGTLERTQDASQGLKIFAAALVVVSKIVGAFARIIVSVLTLAVGQVFNAFKTLGSALIAIFTGDWGALSDIISGFFTDFGTSALESGFEIADSLATGFKEGFGQVDQIFNEGARSITKESESAVKKTTEEALKNTPVDKKAVALAKKRAKALSDIFKELNSDIALAGLSDEQREIREELLRIEGQIGKKLFEQNEAKLKALLIERQLAESRKEGRGFLADLERETELLRLNSREREIQEGLLSAEDSIGVSFGEFAERIENQLRFNQALEEQRSVLDEINGPQEDLNARLEAYSALAAQGAISSQQLEQGLRSIQLAQAELNIASGEGSFQDGFIVGLNNMTDRTRTFASEAGELFAGFFDDLSVGFAETLGEAIFQAKDLGEALKAVARDALQELTVALLRVGFQKATQGILGSLFPVAATQIFSNGDAGGGGGSLFAPAQQTASGGGGGFGGLFGSLLGAATSFLPGGQFLSPLVGAITSGFGGGGGGGGAAPTVNYNIQTPDANSFVRSQRQITSRTQSALGSGFFSSE